MNKIVLLLITFMMLLAFVGCDKEDNHSEFEPVFSEKSEQDEKNSVVEDNQSVSTPSDEVKNENNSSFENTTTELSESSANKDPRPADKKPNSKPLDTNTSNVSSNISSTESSNISSSENSNTSSEVESNVSSSEASSSQSSSEETGSSEVASSNTSSDVNSSESQDNTSSSSTPQDTEEDNTSSGKQDTMDGYSPWY